VQSALASLPGGKLPEANTDPFLKGCKMSKQRNRATIALPKGVHRVVSRGRECLYFQAGRGTNHPGERIKLPSDTQVAGVLAGRAAGSGLHRATADLYRQRAGLADAAAQAEPATKEQYRRSLRVVRTAWGDVKAEALRKDHPELADAVWHGFRANAVIHLRQSGYSFAHISDMIGMSPSMVEHYSQYADRKAGGQAVLSALKQGHNKNRTVKPENWKAESRIFQMFRGTEKRKATVDSKADRI
jgi:predicted transcriptional regulator